MGTTSLENVKAEKARPLQQDLFSSVELVTCTLISRFTLIIGFFCVQRMLDNKQNKKVNLKRLKIISENKAH